MLHIQKPVPSISFPFSVLSAKYPWNSKKKNKHLLRRFSFTTLQKRLKKKRAKCKPERFSVIQTPRGQGGCPVWYIMTTRMWSYFVDHEDMTHNFDFDECGDDDDDDDEEEEED